MKALKPSHKENKRYLLIDFSEDIENPFNELREAILDFSGVLGLSQCGMSPIKTEISKKNQIVVCVNRASVNLIRASLAVYRKKFSVLQVSGTLKGLSKK
mgnify:CR=1 FL=1